ncbi:hypothetical protein KP509_22G073600 [Ceratopteris richardii]|uniref:Uncharacterized protein n=1 Tax=Ceratopteris richardii TaxID=49495 RepID=A0A8T2S6D1_CERRI|nr:hypothetical protein KP509_22G073600 [Ceratopteris richardii]
MGMEPIVYDTKCCLHAEELTLTPHHTPSHSFDFIVWDKAYLDAISSNDVSASASKSTIAAATIDAREEPHVASAYDDRGSPSCLRTSHTTKAALLSCTTDADLPSCFLDAVNAVSPTPPCSCDEGEYFTLLEEAVRRSFPNIPSPLWRKEKRDLVGSKLTDHPRRGHSSCHGSHIRRPQLVNVEAESKPLRSADTSFHSNGFIEPLHLHRSLSQPGTGGEGGTVALGKRTTSNSHTLQLYAIVSDDNRQTIRPRREQKMPCFPTGLQSPGRRRWQQQSTNGYGETKVHLQQHNSFPLPFVPMYQTHESATPFHWPPSLCKIARSGPAQSAPPRSWSRSFSQKSASENHSNHAQNVEEHGFSKLRWRGLNQKLKGLWRKLCASHCPLHM